MGLLTVYNLVRIQSVNSPPWKPEWDSLHQEPGHPTDSYPRPPSTGRTRAVPTSRQTPGFCSLHVHKCTLPEQACSVDGRRPDIPADL